MLCRFFLGSNRVAALVVLPMLVLLQCSLVFVISGIEKSALLFSMGPSFCAGINAMLQGIPLTI